MKKIQIFALSIICYCFTCSLSVAQVTNNIATHLQDIDRILQPLDKSQIPTGILSEAAYQFVNPQKFHADSAISTFDLRALYATLQSGRVSGQQLLGDIPFSDSYAGCSEGSRSLALPIIRYQYNTLRKDAVESGLVSISNNQLYDVPNRNQSPYLSHKVLAASTNRHFEYMKDINNYGNSIYRNDSLEFMVCGSVFFSNINEFPSAAEADFDDGRGFVNMFSNNTDSNFTSSHKVLYRKSGKKHIKLRLSFASGVETCTIAFWVVGKDENLAASRYTSNDFYSLNIQPIGNSNGHSGGTAWIHLSTRNPTRNLPISQRRFRRPLIVLKGYDPSAAISVAKPYTYEDFLDGINLYTPNFNRELDETEEYDLIFLDYTNDVDDITRNARLLKHLLVTVNGLREVGSQPTVLLGVSMGGLIARYGVAEMEKARRLSPSPQNDHQVSLVLTLDSPHQGANVPVGLQYLIHSALDPSFPLRPVAQLVNNAIYYFSSTGDLLKQVSDYIDAPVNAQLLYYRVVRNNSGSATIVRNTWLETTYRNMVTFPASAPSPYRFVAVSNGSSCGIGNPLEGNTLININANLYINGFLADDIFRFRVEANAIDKLGVVGQTLAKLKYSVESNILGINVSKDVLWEDKWITNGSENLLPLDKAAGGFLPLSTKATPTIDALNFNYIFVTANANNAYGAERFCFVPAFSAIDAVAPVTVASLTQNYRPDVVPSPSRALNFQMGISSARTVFNEFHTQFTRINTEFILATMRGSLTPQVCMGNCMTGDDIAGANAICDNSQSYQYSIFNGVLPANITNFGGWTVNDPTAPVILQNNMTATCTLFITDPNFRGTIELRATFNSCNTADIGVLTKNIQVGSLSPILGIRYLPSVACQLRPVVFRAPNDPFVTEYVWETYYLPQFSSPILIDTQTSSSSQYVYDFPQTSGRHLVQIKGRNGCGETAWAETYLNINVWNSLVCKGRVLRTWSVFPNPSSSTLNIGYSNENEALLNSLPEEMGFTAKLSNMYQQIVATAQSNDGKNTTISVTNLQKGMY